MGGTHFLQTDYLLLNRNAPSYNIFLLSEHIVPYFTRFRLFMTPIDPNML